MDVEIWLNLTKKFIKCSQLAFKNEFILQRYRLGVKKMFSITDRAYTALKEVVDKEQNENEKLFIRVSMGIG